MILLIIDRDGTLIRNNNFLGRFDNWKDELILNDKVITIVKKLQKENNTKSIVVTNQAGVARGYFNFERVEEINQYLNELLIEKGVIINNWQYCPDIDSQYAESKKNEIKFDYEYVKTMTKRKPSINMVLDGLKNIDKKLEDFAKIIVIGDRDEDKDLATNLKAEFIDVRLI